MKTFVYRLSSIVAMLLLFGASTASAQGILLPPEESGGPLELRSHEVDFRVDGQAAVTKVTHRFFNPAPRQTEATFYFPIPEGAATTDFAIWMNGERVPGDVLPRDEARQIYESIVRRLRDPGLLEYVNGTLFQARIFPVPARGEQTVEIEYATTLERNGNVVHYHYPVHTESNFVATNFIVNGEIRNDDGIAQVYSPHYAVDASRESADRFDVSAELSRERLTNDFELFITGSDEDVTLSVLSWDGAEDDEDGYFMMTLAPSPELRELQKIPREVTFVVDTSGSMSGDKMEQARELLEYCVNELEPGDRFNIITFASTVDSLFDEIQTVNRQSQREALSFIRNLDAAGGTNIDGAMKAAMEYATSGDHAGSVFFVTDGIPTSGERNISNILENVDEAFEDDGRRLFAFGVGYDVNTRLLDGMARRGTGRSDYVRPGEDLANAIGAFFDSVSAPLLTDVELDFGGADVFRVYPEETGVLYQGDEIVLFGRFENQTSTHVTLRGRAGGDDWSERYPATFGQASEGSDRSFIGNLWASRRVAALLRDIDENGENDEAVQSVVQLATRWNIVTPYTSYLAVDPSEQVGQLPQPPIRRRPGRPVDEPMMDREAAPAASGSGLRDGGSSFGSRGRQAQAAPMRSERRASTGEASVAESMAMNELEERDSVADADDSARNLNRRTVDGRTFERRSGVWIEAGINGPATRTITYMSDEYFDLLRRNPELRRTLALGEQIKFRLGGEVVEIVASP